MKMLDHSNYFLDMKHAVHIGMQCVQMHPDEHVKHEATLLLLW